MMLRCLLFVGGEKYMRVKGGKIIFFESCCGTGDVGCGTGIAALELDSPQQTECLSWGRLRLIGAFSLAGDDEWSARLHLLAMNGRSMNVRPAIDDLVLARSIRHAAGLCCTACCRIQADNLGSLTFNPLN